MIPNNTKSGIISIIRFSGEKKHSTFSAASFYCILAVDAAKASSRVHKNRPSKRPAAIVYGRRDNYRTDFDVFRAVYLL